MILFLRGISSTLEHWRLNPSYIFMKSSLKFQEFLACCDPSKKTQQSITVGCSFSCSTCSRKLVAHFFSEGPNGGAGGPQNDGCLGKGNGTL